MYPLMLAPIQIKSFHFIKHRRHALQKNNLNVAVTYKTPLSDICFDVFCLIDSSSLLSIHYLYYSVRKRTFLNIHQPNRLSKNQIPSYYISVIYPSIIRNVLHLNSLALTYFRQVLWCFFYPN